MFSKSSGFYSACWKVSLLFCCCFKEKVCFFLCLILRFSVIMPVSVHVYMHVHVFCVYPTWGSWDFLNYALSLIRLGKFSAIIHSNAAVTPFFSTLFLITRMWDFLTVSHTFLCFVLFSFFFYILFSLNFSFRSKYPKVWIFSLGPVWVPLIVSLLLAAFLLKTTNKFLILYFSIIECQFDYFSIDSKTVETFHLFIHLFLSSCF